MLNPMCVPFSGKNDSYQNEKFMRGCRFLEAELQNMDQILAGRYVILSVIPRLCT